MNDFQEMIEAALADIKTLSVSEVQALSIKNETQFIDLRDIRERQRDGHIPGDFHCPRGMLEFWIHAESPYYKPIFSVEKTFIFYCASGWRSALATKTAQELGLENAAHIEGGLTQWKAETGKIATLPKRD